MEERATPPPLRACAMSVKSLRVPAKSTRGAARAHVVHESLAGAPRPPGRARVRPGSPA
jgi:hypothetical protein